MKAVTINVSAPVYAEFQKYARESDRTTSELIREAMDRYREEKIRGRRSLVDSRPARVGAVLRGWDSRGDLLEGYWDARD